MVAFVSCSVTKYVPEGEYLLNKEKLTIDGKGIEQEDLQPFIHQHPNSTFLWTRLSLWFYNRSNPSKNRWIDRKLFWKFGEKPVIYDSIQAIVSAMRMQEYLAHRGYYGNNVEVRTKTKGKKANLQYNVHLGEPLRIGNISYSILDSILDSCLIVDDASLLHSGDIFDGDVLENERLRIAHTMRNNGYYAFNKNYITYESDSTVGNHTTDVTTIVHQELADPLKGTRRLHRKFVVDNITLNTDYSPVDAIEDTGYMRGWDTISAYGFKQIYKGRPGLLPTVAAMYNKIEAGKLYNEKAENATYDNFSRLRLFQSVNLQFTEIPQDSADIALHTPVRLNTAITMTPQKLMNYRLIGEVSMSGTGLWGANAGISYQHKNLFRGAEIFDVNFNTIFQKIQWRTDDAPQNSLELSAGISINVPQFSIPLNLKLYSNLLSPRTLLAVSGNYQQRPDYTRWLSSLSFGYSWQNMGNMTYIWMPIDINLININKTGDTDFFDSFKNNPYLMSAYQNTFLLGSTFAAIYNTRRTASASYSYLRLDIDLKGNILYGIYKLAGATQAGDADDRYYEILKTRFAQFAKININYTYLRTLGERTALALRGIFGLGTAYGNSLTMPFDKMYYAGGPYSMRGWQIRGLGPGSYYNTESAYIINRIANMRAEFNAEYRVKLVGLLEGAVFFDAGNIWAINKGDTREGAQFSFAALPKTIAMDWGLGLRYNIGSIIVIRLDYGMQLHNPVEDGKYFVTPRSWLNFFNGDHSAIIVALGYPF
jgi:outer membrane protein assembly factor BamA